MKNNSILTRLSLTIAALSLLAAGAGLFWTTNGGPFPYTTVRGETVTINGQGLYYYDSADTAAQAQAQDLVTLAVGIPLLLLSLAWSRDGSLRGKLLLSGTLAYFLYTYTSLSFGAAFNALFLVYVAIFSLSLFAFILSMMAFDLQSLPERFSGRLPRKGIAAFLFFSGAFLLLAWLGRIAPALLQNQPPFGLEHNTTLFIQTLDLGLIVPLAFLSGGLLLRRRPWGYLLASVALMKFITMGLAVSAMAINLVLVGAQINPVELIVFPGITIANLVAAALLLKNIDRPSPTPLAAEAG